MGANQSQTSKMSNFLEKHEKVNSYTDQRYGDISLYKPKTSVNGKVLMVKSSITQNPKTALHKKISEKSSQYLTKILAYFKQTEKKFCAEYTKNTIVLEIPMKTLKKEIDILNQNFNHLKLKKVRGIF
jgi:hypothetical protein